MSNTYFHLLVNVNDKENLIPLLLTTFKHMPKTFVFYVITVLFSLIFSTFSVLGATDHHIINWTDSRHLHNQLDLISGRYQQEVRPGQWKDANKVELISVDLSEFPGDYNIHAHKVKSGFIFNVPGTGLVFSLDSNNKQFKRIDNTFFRGFNFLSYSLVRKDTLFSIGGSGFWSANSTLIYFDIKHKEWEKIPTINKGPNSLENNFCGYSTSNDTFYALSGYEEFTDNAFSKKLFYSLDLTTRTWKELGLINTELFKDKISNAKYWLGDFLLYLYGDKPDVYLLDPIKNRILLYEGKNNQLKLGSNEITRDGNNIFIYRKESAGVAIDSISVQELFKDSREVGKLYIPKTEFPWLIIISTALLLSVLFAVYFFLRMKKFEKRNLLYGKSGRIEDLPEHLKNLLRYFKINGKEAMLSTNQMNELLEIKSNSFETSRQQRSRDIKAIMDYFEIHHNISDAIQRKNSEVDKRNTIYCLDEKAYKVLSKMSLDGKMS
ncbi:MAG: hypothetical protein RLZ10_606 [Bacteroidota bacterium]|jgi:hypothetical protein